MPLPENLAMMKKFRQRSNMKFTAGLMSWKIFPKNK
jgi:hypothetical protein